jgi:RNA polymerase sigma-70 factor (ECF subfamily)
MGAQSSHYESSQYGGRLDDPTQWVDRFGDALYAYAVSRVGDGNLAEDLVQETFVAGISAMDRYRGSAAPLTWLTSILRHKIADQYRKQRRDHGQDATEKEPWPFTEQGKWRVAIKPWPGDPAERLESQEFWSTFEQCLGQLPPTIAAAFRLRELEGLDAQRACETLQITAGNLSVRMHRARLWLRECLDRHWFQRE